MEVQQELGDLHGVGGSALTDVVADAPEIEGIRLAEILADAPHEHVVLPPGIERHRINVVRGIVLHGDARLGSHQGADLLQGEGLAGFNVDAFRMGLEIGRSQK